MQIIFDVSHEDCSQGGGEGVLLRKESVSKKSIFPISVPTGNVFSSQLSLTIGNQGGAGFSNPAIDWDNGVSCCH